MGSHATPRVGYALGVNEPRDDETPGWYMAIGSLGGLLVPILTVVDLAYEWFPGSWLLALETACAGFSVRISFLLTFLVLGALLLVPLELMRAIGTLKSPGEEEALKIPGSVVPAARMARARKIVTGLGLLGVSKIFLAVCIFAPALLSSTYVLGWLLLFLIPLGPSFGLLMVLDGLLPPRVSLGTLNEAPVVTQGTRQQRYAVVGTRRAPVPKDLALPPLGSRVFLVQLRLYGRAIAVVPG